MSGVLVGATLQLDTKVATAVLQMAAHLFDGEARLEQAARAFVSQIMKAQIFDLKLAARAPEGSTP